MEEGAVGVGEQSKLNTLLVMQQVGSEEAWGTLEIIAFIPEYFQALWSAAIWDFAFLTGVWIYIKWIIWAPLMAMFIWGLVITFITIFQKVLS